MHQRRKVWSVSTYWVSIKLYGSEIVYRLCRTCNSACCTNRKRHFLVYQAFSVLWTAAAFFRRPCDDLCFLYSTWYVCRISVYYVWNNEFSSNLVSVRHFWPVWLITASDHIGLQQTTSDQISLNWGQVSINHAPSAPAVYDIRLKLCSMQQSSNALRECPLDKLSLLGAKQLPLCILYTISRLFLKCMTNYPIGPNWTPPDPIGPLRTQHQTSARQPPDSHSFSH